MREDGAVLFVRLQYVGSQRSSLVESYVLNPDLQIHPTVQVANIVGLEYACSYAHISTFKIVTRDKRFDLSFIFDSVCRKGDLDVAKWIKNFLIKDYSRIRMDGQNTRQSLQQF